MKGERGGVVCGGAMGVAWTSGGSGFVFGVKGDGTEGSEWVGGQTRRKLAYV